MTLRRRLGRCVPLREESGLSLVEVIVGLGISVFVMAFVGTVAFQIYRVTTWANDRLLLASDVQTAALWLSRDVVQANQFTAGTAPDYGVFTIPTDAASKHVRYSYDPAGNTLTRTDLSTGETVIVSRDIQNQADLSFAVLGRLVTVDFLVGRAGQTDTASMHFFMRVP
jgi:YD repeat-containing protein